MKTLKLLAVLPVILIEMVFACLEIVTSMISGALALTRVRLFKEYDYRNWLKRDLADCATILELGCGPPSGFLQTKSPLLQIGYGNRVNAFDIWQPYIDAHKKAGSFNRCWQADILETDLPIKHYDAVVMFDVLEHLPKEKVEQIDLLARMENCAIKKVILFTPNGYVENDFVDGDPSQAHLSAWEPEYYIKRGYKVVGATGPRWLLGKASLPKYRPHIVCSLLAMLSQPLIYYKANWGWHSYAVKELI